MIGWVIGGAAAAAVAGLLASRARHYRRLLSDAHFLEIARGLPRLKAGALATSGEGPTTREDPRILSTSAGLAVIYTIKPTDAGFVHHCSVSVPGGYTAHALGGPTIVFVARLLGLAPEHLALAIGRSTVHHCEVTLDPAAHEALAAAAVPELAVAQVGDERRAAHDASARLAWTRLGRDR